MQNNAERVLRPTITDSVNKRLGPKTTHNTRPLSDENYLENNLGVKRNFYALVAASTCGHVHLL